MPKDLSTELDLTFWEAWFFEVCAQAPQGTDSWACHCLDALQTYTMGGEL